MVEHQPSKIQSPEFGRTEKEHKGGGGGGEGEEGKGGGEESTKEKTFCCLNLMPLVA